jgi:hypothetical protein
MNKSEGKRQGALSVSYLLSTDLKGGLAMTERIKDKDPLFYENKAFGKLAEIQYKAEIELAEQYKSFVAEILRLSLLGIAVFGFLYTKMFDETSIKSAKIIAGIGVTMFGFSSALALFFRYMATDGIRYYIMAFRFSVNEDNDNAQESLDKRRKILKSCLWSKTFAAIFLGLGGIFVAISMFMILNA